MNGAIILWDIDGTILRGGGIGQRTLEKAFREALGDGHAARVDLGPVPFHGNTDPAIIAAGLELFGAPVSEAMVAAIAERYLAILGAEVARENPFVRLPGVLELAERLAALDFHQGLGTGNLEAAAWLKVEAVGMRQRFAFGGFGSDAADRAELLRIGRDRGARQLGLVPERCRVVVIGDTLKDIAAARAIGAEVVAVATGGESHAALADARPNHLFESFEDVDEVIAAIT